MQYTDNALNVLTAKTFKGIGRAWVVQNIRGGESLEQLEQLLARKLKVDVAEIRKKFLRTKEDLRASIEKMSDYADGLVARGDEDFPKMRNGRVIKDSEYPVVLFYRGDLSILSTTTNVAVIGLLSPDEGVVKAEQRVVSMLAQHATIVSGLALGCDSVAHLETIQSKGKTVAVLPCSLDSIIPSSNKELADIIVSSGGLLLTEYDEQFKSKQELITRYIERDRLQALFSDAIILVASYAPNVDGNDSGSRHAMEYAKSYGISRYVIYNPSKHIGNPMFDLNRKILEEDASVQRIDSSNLQDIVRRIIQGEEGKDLFTNTI